MLFSSLLASAHGYTESPISRQKLCKNGGVANCGAIIWEPQSVEGPKGFPGAGPADGVICSAGVSRFAELDNPRNGTWPTTKVNAGSRNVTWNFTARHATTSYRYFITKQNWDPTKKLTRSALESAPFTNIKKNGARPGETETHSISIPSRTGRQLILAVWDIDDTANAFYSCIDVQF